MCSGVVTSALVDGAAGLERRAPLHRGLDLAEDQDPAPLEARHVPRRLENATALPATIACIASNGRSLAAGRHGSSAGRVAKRRR
jgi:hypothetical protein